MLQSNRERESTSRVVIKEKEEKATYLITEMSNDQNDWSGKNLLNHGWGGGGGSWSAATKDSAHIALTSSFSFPFFFIPFLFFLSSLLCFIFFCVLKHIFGRANFSSARKAATPLNH